MDQNNYNQQPNSAPYGNPYPQQPATPYGNPYPQQPYGYYPQPAQPTGNHPEVDAIVGSAFGKCLAATIMCSFPIASIISIVLGSSGLKQVNQANDLANYYRVSAGGKCVAAKILGKIGKIAGIVMTCFYAVYILLMIYIFSSYMYY